MPDQPSVLVVGATGMMGGKIASALLDRGAAPRLMIRRAGYDGEKAEAIKALTDRGATTVEADLAETASLDPALEGIDVVVSSVQGFRDVIVEGQTALLEAAERAGSKRFIPSDFSVDFFDLEEGSNRNLDLRREFNRRLDQSSVAGTSVLNGAFMEMLLFGFPVLDRETHRFNVWGDPQQKLQFTATDDAAAYAAEAALDPNAPRKLCVAGADVTQTELQAILETWLGTSLERRMVGDIAALTDEIARERADANGEEDLFPRWQALQYLHNMASGAGYMKPLENARYPAVNPMSLEEFLKRTPPR